MKSARTVVDHVLNVLRQKGAHQSFRRTVSGWPVGLRGMRPVGAPHSPWQLVEHMRIAQWDILEFSRREDHVSPEFPDGYWPASETPPDADAWDRSIEAFEADNKAMQDLVADPKTDLLARIPWSDGATILREALLVADHNAYHLGQLVLIRRLLGAGSGAR